MKSDSTITNNPQENKPPIVVSHVGKRFKLYEEKESTLKSTVINLLKKRRLTKHEFWSLKDINFTVKKGETLGIIGPNGSGKSTMLKILAGIIYPTEGTIQTEGRVSTLFELGTGFHPELSGRENVYLNGAILGLSRKQVKEKYDSIVEFAELKDFIEMPLKHYSSGMQMRLAFAIAISINPDILLVDEVLAVGDAAFQAKSFAAFEQFKKKGATIVLVSHDLASVQEFCSRVIVLESGKIKLIDEPTRAATLYQGFTERKLEKQDELKIESINNIDELGLGKVSIFDVEFFGESNKPQKTLVSNEPFSIKIHYTSKVNIKNPVVGLAFHNKEGLNLAGPNNKIDKMPFSELKQKGTIEYKMPELPLIDGIYSLTVAIYDKDCRIPYTFRDKSFKFRVKTKGEKRVGLVRMNGKWTIKN